MYTKFVCLAAVLAATATATATGPMYTAVALGVHKYPLSTPVFCPQWTFPNEPPFTSPTNVSGLPSPIPFYSPAEAAANSFPFQPPQTFFYFQMDVCAPLYLPNDPIGGGYTFPTLGSNYKLTYNASNTGNEYQFLYQCSDSACAHCSLTASFPVGGSSCDVSQVRNATVQPYTFAVLLSIPSAPIPLTSLLAGIAIDAAPQNSLLAGMTNVPVTAVYVGTSQCDNTPSYFRFGASFGTFGLDCYSSVLTPAYYGAFCSGSGNNMQLTIAGFTSGTYYQSCNVPNLLAGNGNFSYLGGTLLTDQPSYATTPAVPASRAGSVPAIRECTASGCQSQLFSSITFCSGANYNATFLPRTAASTVTCPATPAPTTLPATTMVTTVAPSTAASLAASLTLFVSLLAAALAL